MMGTLLWAHTFWWKFAWGSLGPYSYTHLKILGTSWSRCVCWLRVAWRHRLLPPKDLRFTPNFTHLPLTLFYFWVFLWPLPHPWSPGLRGKHSCHGFWEFNIKNSCFVWKKDGGNCFFEPKENRGKMHGDSKTWGFQKKTGFGLTKI